MDERCAAAEFIEQVSKSIEQRYRTIEQLVSNYRTLSEKSIELSNQGSATSVASPFCALAVRWSCECPVGRAPRPRLGAGRLVPGARGRAPRPSAA